jgi:hypothetical protein
LRDSLLLILNRVEAVEKGYEKLHSNQKVLQKYMEDLTTIHQTTASDSHEKHWVFLAEVFVVLPRPTYNINSWNSTWN